MKNFLTSIFFVSFGLIIGTPSTFASVFDIGGSPYNPLYIQIEQDPFQQKMQGDSTQKSANTQKENYLKSTYGLDNYYSCSSSRGSDFADPYSTATYLSGVQYCLERKSLSGASTQSNVQPLTQGYTDNYCKKSYGPLSYNDVSRPGCACLPGSTVGYYELGLAKQGCVLTPEVPKTPPPPTMTNDEVCKNNYGEGWKWDGTINDKGRLNCGCASGYYPNPDNECTLMPKTPPAPTKTNNEICQDTYANSHWDGTKNNDGGLICDCKAGYEWNQAQTQCVSAPKTKSKETDEVSLQNSKDQACQESYGEYSLSKNGRCGCMVGYTIGTNEGKTACVLETINEQKTVIETLKIETPIQRKSLWARIKAWFGYD
jgi:hypothetical protein